MRIFSKVLFFLGLALAMCESVQAQDPQFTQFFANPLYISPSYAGASRGHRAVLSYRDQWSGLPNMYRTMSASYDVNVASLRSGFGIFALGDLAGDGHLGTIYGGAVYSYSLEMVPGWYFRPGLGFYVIQRSIQYKNLIFGDQLVDLDNVSPTTQQTLGKPTDYDIDVSSSILFHSTNAWVGATWDHMLRPKASFFGEDARVPFKFTAHGGYRFVIQSLYRRGIDQSVTVAANARFQGLYSQAEVGGYWFKYPFMLGVWYRGIPLVKNYLGSDAIAFMVGLRFESIQVAYSYDLTVSHLGPASGGAHEVSLTYEAKITPRKRKYKAPECPPY